jgi:hypothetical protein
MREDLIVVRDRCGIDRAVDRGALGQFPEAAE